jgi:hypothetical protein
MPLLHLSRLTLALTIAISACDDTILLMGGDYHNHINNILHQIHYHERCLIRSHVIVVVVHMIHQQVH